MTCALGYSRHLILPQTQIGQPLSELADSFYFAQLAASSFHAYCPELTIAPGINAHILVRQTYHRSRSIINVPSGAKSNRHTYAAVILASKISTNVRILIIPAALEVI